MNERVIYVAARDDGHEGYGLPVLAFDDRETALRWAAGRPTDYVVKEVPIYPSPAAESWTYLEPIEQEIK